MSPDDYIVAARVPERLKPQTFGLWTIRRQNINDHQYTPAQRLELMLRVGFDSITALHHMTLATMHTEPGECVMEDSVQELRRHLPIWLRARGRVLVTGLGLGCVVRGLLANPDVDHVDVVELDRSIARVVGHEFVGHPRVKIHVADALRFPVPDRITWDFAWHDLWHEGGNGSLQRLHAKLFLRYRRSCREQGAWAWPRFMSKLMPWRPINAPKTKPPARRIAAGGTM